MDLQQRQDEREGLGRGTSEGQGASPEQASGPREPGVQLRSMDYGSQQANLRPSAPVQLNPAQGSGQSTAPPAAGNTGAASGTDSSASSGTGSNTGAATPAPHAVFSHAKAGSGAEIRAIVASGVATEDQINTMLSRGSVTTAALLQQKCTEFGNWTHVGLYFGTDADYATAMGAHFTSAMGNLDPGLVASAVLPGSGGTPQMDMDQVDYIEQHLISTITPYAPPSLSQKVATVWPPINGYRTQWSQAIQAAIAETNTLATNIQADPATYWPTSPASEPLPGFPFYSRAWGAARAVNQPVWDASWQALQQQMNQVIQTSIANANTHADALLGGTPLQPEAFYEVRDRLNLILERSGNQQTSVNQVLSKLSEIEAVRTDHRIQPHATKGNYMIPPGELHLYVNEGAGQGRGSFGATAGQAAPTEEELTSFISRRDVIQGEGLADCFLVAVLSSVADTNPSLIANAITEPSPGTFNVTLHAPITGWGPPSGGTFQQVTISVDHEIPHVDRRGQLVSGVATLRETVLRNGLLQMMRISAPDVLRELWAVIMEKALAKAYPNGYRSIGNGGHSNVVFQMLTGAVANVSHLPAATAGDPAKDATWNTMNAHVTANRPATAGSDAMRIIQAASPAGIIAGLRAGRAKDPTVFDGFVGGGMTLDSMIAGNQISVMRHIAQTIYHGGQSKVQSATMRPIGLDAQVYAWHAYSIIGTREVHDPSGTSQRYVKLRNPWGVVTSDRGNFGEFELTYDEFLNRYGNITLGNFNTGTP